MIFVTVGTGRFDNLVEEADNISKKIKEEIIIQIGNGQYIPKNCKYFRFKNDLGKEYKNARIIIAHGGAGTTYELLVRGKKIISVANLDRTDTHQEEILRALSEDHYLIWCKDMKDIFRCILLAKNFNFKKYKKPECKIAEKINEFLK